MKYIAGPVDLHFELITRETIPYWIMGIILTALTFTFSIWVVKKLK